MSVEDTNYSPLMLCNSIFFCKRLTCDRLKKVAPKIKFSCRSERKQEMSTNTEKGRCIHITWLKSLYFLLTKNCDNISFVMIEAKKEVLTSNTPNSSIRLAENNINADITVHTSHPTYHNSLCHQLSYVKPPCIHNEVVDLVYH